MQKPQKFLQVDDFMFNAKKAFKFMGWNPFGIGPGEVTEHSSRILHFLRMFYMLITNFYIVFGLILQTIYCFASVGKPNAFLKITNTAPIIGENENFIELFDL